MGVDATLVASQLHLQLGAYASANDWGKSGVEVFFRLPLENDRQRRPDVALVSYERWPKHQQRLHDDAWDVAPDLSVEVVSTNDRAEALQETLGDYFQAGVRQVWVIYPRSKLAYIFGSLTSVRVVLEHDDLEGGESLPGFRLRLGNLFS